MKILFSSNISWSIYNFRLPLLKSLQKEGHTIYTLALKDNYSQKLIDQNFYYYEIDINNNSTNPLKDFKLIYQYLKIYKEIKPDVICHNAIKPNIYGTLVAKYLGIPVVNNISGLGTLFIKKSISTYIAKFLYKLSQKRADLVFFQNKDDFREFKKYGLIKPENCKIIPGSGVNTNHFKPSNFKETKSFQFIFIGRLIFDKGIREYIQALRILKEKKFTFQAAILGPIYHSNSTAITKKNLNSWVKEKLITYLGESDEVVKFMQDTECLVLPSYREGLSKVLIEASSVGIPIVTTNVPGCKDVIIDGETGYLCNVKSSLDLASKLEIILTMKEKDRHVMGLKGRKHAIENFDEKIIIDKYKKAIEKVTT